MIDQSIMTISRESSDSVDPCREKGSFVEIENDWNVVRLRGCNTYVQSMFGRFLLPLSMKNANACKNFVCCADVRKGKAPAGCARDCPYVVHVICMWGVDVGHHDQLYEAMWPRQSWMAQQLQPESLLSPSVAPSLWSRVSKILQVWGARQGTTTFGTTFNTFC